MKNNKTLMLTQLALLTAIEVILTFTPLGFIMIPPVSITVLHIPVIVGAILTGKKGGAVLGGVFGICHKPHGHGFFAVSRVVCRRQRHSFPHNGGRHEDTFGLPVRRYF